MLKAKYPGPCPKCGKKIDVGDDIIKVGKKWVHVGCEKKCLANISSKTLTASVKSA